MAKSIDGLAADFGREHPGIKIKPVDAGSHQDTLTKVLTAVKGGDAPQMAVIRSTDMFTLIDEGAILPFDDLVKGEFITSRRRQTSPNRLTIPAYAGVYAATGSDSRHRCHWRRDHAEPATHLRSPVR
jgi:ABC-type glycerol-3-phosphate transport system substrate-binding protein